MNLQTAQQLLDYRKAAGLSQEELAEKIGVSRQAVSKWERGEASPDTDNLIALADVYGVTLDELIKGKKESAPLDEGDTEPAEEPRDSVHISFKDGIHVKDKNGESVHVDWHGVHVDSGDTNVHIDEKGVFVKENGHIYADFDHSKSSVYKALHLFPYPVLATVLYLVFGFLNICGGWAYGWLIMLTIPLYYTIISAVANRNASHFAYPVLVTLLYLFAGFKYSLWHPSWIIFLTIPLYYFIVEFFKKLIKAVRERGEID